MEIQSRNFSYFLTYPNLPIDIIFYGIESGFKRLQPEYELSISFSYFNDQNLKDKREKAEKYAEELNLNEGNEADDSKFQKYYPYLKLYSNTPNLKGTLSITEKGTLNKNLSSSITFKGTSAYDFVSGYFEATEEGKGQIPATAAGQSFFEIQDN